MRFINKITRFLFSRAFIVALLILIQAAYLLIMIIDFGNYYPYVQLALLILSFLAFIRILNTNRDPGFTLAWIIPILLVPLLGGLMYLLFGGSHFGRMAGKRLGIDQERMQKILQENAVPEREIQDPSIRQQVHFLCGRIPLWNTSPWGR